MDRQGLIGNNNRLPWRLPADMQWFRKQTLGKPIVMGRATWESFGARPLPQRHNIIVTRQTDYLAAGGSICHSLQQGLDLGGAESDEVVVIGGASIYQQALILADRLYVTQVEGVFEGDTWFPEVEWRLWQLQQESWHEIDAQNSYRCHFATYYRRTHG